MVDLPDPVITRCWDKPLPLPLPLVTGIRTLLALWPGTQIEGPH